MSSFSSCFSFFSPPSSLSGQLTECPAIKQVVDTVKASNIKGKQAYCRCFMSGTFPQCASLGFLCVPTNDGFLIALGVCSHERTLLDAMARTPSTTSVQATTSGPLSSAHKALPIASFLRH